MDLSQEDKVYLVRAIDRIGPMEALPQSSKVLTRRRQIKLRAAALVGRQLFVLY